MSTDPSVCIYSVLFTVKGQDPAKNRYLDMALLWMSQLLALKFLTPRDCVKLCADRDTLLVLQSQMGFGILYHEFPCPFEVVIADTQPATVQEGALLKYKVPMNHEQDILFYMDIDVVPVKPISPCLARMEPETVYLHPEGELRDISYSQSIPAALLDKLPTSCLGFSAGKFAIRGRRAAAILFLEISTILREHAASADGVPQNYTLEQPFFNQAVYQRILANDTRLRFDFKLFNEEVVSSNGNRIGAETLFFDYMGEPGNQDLHWSKAVNLFSVLHACGGSFPWNDDEDGAASGPSADAP